MVVAVCSFILCANGIVSHLLPPLHVRQKISNPILAHVSHTIEIARCCLNHVRVFHLFATSSMLLACRNVPSLPSLTILSKLCQTHHDSGENLVFP